MRKRDRTIAAIAIPCAVLLLFFMKDRLLELSEHFPRCSFYMLTGYYCPGCGNTRSVRALMQGDILLAVRSNPIIPFSCLVGILAYAELIAGFSGREVRILPRKMWFWIIVIAVFTVFYFVRNFIPEIAPVPVGYHGGYELHYF